jgi:hypothetical protein
MRNLLIRVLAASLFLGGFVAARGDDDDEAKPTFKSGPQPGTRSKPVHIPSSFQLWMVTGPRAHRYHSVVCEHGLNPVAFIFIKELDPENKPHVTLLKKLDDQIARHPDARFGVCLVVLNDGGFREVLEKDDEGELSKRLAETGYVKDVLEAKLKELAKNEKLDNITMALDTKAGPRGYQLSEDAAVTVLFYNKHIVRSSFAFKGKLTEQDAERVAGDIEKTVLEVERLSRPTYRNRTIKRTR